ncbi:hypothetical protein GL213_06855 [Halogeometricum borinquense]|nr:hypothetical protein GL213_06855 [Halogeometricum borinquense]
MPKRTGGSDCRTDLSADDLADFLARADMPVIYDGDIHWSGDLHRELD